MGVKSGMGGTIDGANTIISWSVTDSSDNQEYRASNTVGGTGRIVGNTDWTASLSAYVSTPHLMPGDAITFVGYGPEKASGTGIVDSIDVECDVEAGSIIKTNMTVSGNGVIAYSVGSISDSTVPNPPSSIGVDLNWAGTDIVDFRKYSFSITSDNKAYASSETAGGMKRVAGPMDISGSFDMYTDDFNDLPAKGDIETIKMFVDGTDFWQIAYAIVDAIDTTTDVESGDLVGATISWSFTGFKAGTLGNILKPGDLIAASWWGATS